MKTRSKTKTILSALLSAVMLFGSMPVVTYAAQVNEYTDPADNWLTANGRTNELDMNATITQETSYCTVCERDTLGTTYRVPEYTKSGETALNRGVKYSDGTLIDGEGTGNLDDGTPGVDAFFTAYHWTKSVCSQCGTMNSLEGPDIYNFNRNVYALYSCDHNFFFDFDNTEYEPYNDSYHTTVLKKGQYCQFCRGTQARASEKQEAHHFSETIDEQIGNNRFFVSEECSDCGYETSEYITAKSVVSSYYGNADGEAHTVTVSDLSDNGVHTSIRYGTSAEKCNLTSAPNYTEAGYYPVYYEIDYEYDNKNMTENGVSYVWLLEKEGDTIIVVPPAGSEDKHEHDFRYLETVAPSCENLGFERWQCGGCGALEKRNYTPAIGHDYEDITIREATCKQGGFVLSLCKNCGDFHEETTPTGNHNYKSEVHNPTCRNVGYTEYTCTVCGDTYTNNMTPMISHAFEKITKAPSCEKQGYTTSTCSMCGLNYVSDYTEPTGHHWDNGTPVTSSTCTAEGVIEYHCQNENCRETMIKSESAAGHTEGAAATCTEPQICEVCGTVLELPTGHKYSETIIAPTCEAMGYSIFECADCGDSYTGNFTDKAEHSYHTEVTGPTCTAMGFTTYTCVNCEDEYVSDYTDKIPHNYKAEVTNPTCTEMGFTVFTCENCSDSYTSNYVEMTEHNYSRQIIPPTCTEHGYTIYTCPDCGKEYIGDLTECEQHKYSENIIPPTCLEMGYTVFTCDCGDTYKGNYIDALGHDYAETVTAPTCTELGYSTFTCNRCADSYKGNYAEALGHTPTDWVIDTPATIEQAGEKHIECSACKSILKTSAIPQLADKDNSDEDGTAEVGAYSIILTDKDAKPVFDSEITIDTENNITIKLPEGRLLDFADQTTITVFFTETQSPAKDLHISVSDQNGNHATGTTDENGQLKAPNSQSSTGDNNGTIGGGDEENKYTYVVSVTNRENIITENCHIEIGESSDIVVKLPQGLILTQDSPAIITVTDQNGQPQKGVNVIVIGDKDYIEKGVTDMYGKVTVPPVNSGYTDSDGKVNVQGYYVVVNDESKQIANALVTLNEDNTITVLLPAESLIDYANRITVTVLDKDGNPVKDISVTVSDVSEKSAAGTTDENGKMTVPPLSEDYTDKDGKANVNGMNILVADESKPVENAFIKVDENGKIHVTLPETSKISTDNRITVTVTDGGEKAVKNLSIIVSETAAEGAETEAQTAEDVTDENGKIVVPPSNEDYTDKDGNGDISETKPGKGEDTDGDGKEDKPGALEITDYKIRVTDTKGAVENAYVKIEDGKISVKLPDTHTLTTSNQTTVTVLDKDAKPLKRISVTVTDKDNKTETKSTDANGKITVPVKSSGGSSGGGSSRPSGGGGGGGYISTNTVNVKITDKDGKAVTGFSKSTDSKGNVTVTLPNGRDLLNGNWYTVTVTDRNNKAKAETSVTLKDRKSNTASGITDKDGVIVIPAEQHSAYIVGYEDGAFRPDADMSRAEAAAIFARLIAEEKGEKISGTKTAFADVKSNEWYAGYVSYLEKYNIIKGYADKTFKPDAPVTRAEFVSMTVRFYDLFNEVKYPANTTKYSDIDGKHWAVKDISFGKEIGWLNGYADGSFRPENNITRAEAVTVINHATGRTADEDFINKNLSVLNKFTDLKNNSHWGYYGIMEAANSHKAVSNSENEIWVE